MQLDSWITRRPTIKLIPPPGMPFHLFFTLSERRQSPSLLISTFSRTFCCCVLLSLRSLPCPSVISIALTFLHLLSYSLSYFPSLATLFLPLFSCSSHALCSLPFCSFHVTPVPSTLFLFLPFHSSSLLNLYWWGRNIVDVVCILIHVDSCPVCDANRQVMAGQFSSADLYDIGTNSLAVSLKYRVLET